MTFKEHFQAWAMNRKLLCEQELRMYETLIRALKDSEPDAVNDPDIVIPPQGVPQIKQADAKWLTAPPSAPPPAPAQSPMGQILCGCGIPATWWKKGQMYLCGKPYGTPKDQQCGFKRRT